MKFAILALSILAAGSLLWSTGAAEAADNGSKAQQRLNHFVAFKFKDSATPDQIAAVVKAFGDLKNKIPQITSFEWGTNNSPEHHNKGCTHAFHLTFRSEKDRDAYLVHPAHKAFGKLLGPILDDVFVLDYWGQAAP